MKKKKDKEDKEKDKKEKEKNDLSDSIDFSDYVAPDRHQRLNQLREFQSIEMESLKKVRNENLHKINNEEMDVVVCVCRKNIDGFMIRCCLCYEWFHSACVSLPKSINGKSLTKGHSPCDIMKEIKYLCPLCCRSRRPRVDTILSLLFSLQKLPVRLAEGEALQFLIERVMQWQERAKRILQDNNIQKVLTKLSSAILNEQPSNVTSLNISRNIIRDQFGHENTQNNDELSNIVKHEVLSSKENSIPDPMCPFDDKIVIESESELKQKEQEDPLSLECEEQLTESPKSSNEYKEEYKTNEDSILKKSRSTSPVDVCSLNEENRNNVINENQEINDFILDQIEELLMEGLVIEATVDETHQLWSIIQSQRPLQPDDCRILVCSLYCYYYYYYYRKSWNKPQPPNKLPSSKPPP